VHAERGTIDVLEQCFSAVRRAGTVSVVGVYGTSYDNFPLGHLFDKGLRLRAGQAPVHNYVDRLMRLVADGKTALEDIITHTLPLADAPRANEVFNQKLEDCVKVVLERAL
jgi:threonine dehydrogenase-like Zn-dependent dehydrogenase